MTSDYFIHTPEVYYLFSAEWNENITSHGLKCKRNRHYSEHQDSSDLIAKKAETINIRPIFDVLIVCWHSYLKRGLGNKKYLCTVHI